MNKSKIKSVLIIYFFATVFINIVVRIIVKRSPVAAEWYALNIYPALVRFIGGINGIFPFSVVEILIFFLTLIIIAGFIYLIIKLITQRYRRKKILMNGFFSVSVLISTILMMFLFGCEINYSRYPYSYYSGLEVGSYTKEELRSVIADINKELAVISAEIETDEQGAFILREDLITASISAMESIGNRHPSLDTAYYRPKPLITSEIFLSNAGICGVYSPFTIEANFNNHMPDSEKPFTVCHELSHLSGFMREDEANFIAFLACKESGKPDYLFSAYSKALAYCANAYYYAATQEEYLEMYSSIPLTVMMDRSFVNAYWQRYSESTLNTISEEVNDAYLKVNGQEDGVQSYGRFVDLLIAYRMAEDVQ